MASRIEDFQAAIATAVGVLEQALTPPRAITTHTFGLKQSKEHANHPRYHWTLGDDHELLPPTQNIGGKLTSGLFRRAYGLLRYHVTIECWGEDLEEAEEMMVRFGAALRREATGSIRFASGFSGFTIPGETEAQAEYAASGVKYKLNFVVDFPIDSEQPAATTITAHTHTTNFVSDLDQSVEEVVA